MGFGEIDGERRSTPRGDVKPVKTMQNALHRSSVPGSTGRSQHIPRVLALADIWSIHRGLIAVSFGAKKQPKNYDKTLLK